jgi:hypothetical protein
MHGSRRVAESCAQPRVRADAYQRGRYASNVFGMQAPSHAPLNATLGRTRENDVASSHRRRFVTVQIQPHAHEFCPVGVQSALSTICPQSVVLAAGHTRSSAFCGTRSMNVGCNASVLVSGSRLARSGRIMLPNPAFERTRISMVGMRLTAVVCRRLRARRSTPRYVSFAHLGRTCQNWAAEGM